MSVAAVGLVLLLGAAARAQSAAGGVGVLRSTAGPAPLELADAVDAALLRDLADIAGIVDPVVSPIDLAEIQLSVGCADEGRACFEAIARAAGVSALVVRTLAVDEQGRAALELRYFDSASSDQPRAVGTQLPAEQSAELVRAMPSLVRELFGIPEVVEPAPAVAEEPDATAHFQLGTTSSSQSQGGATLWPWIFVGTGVAALTTGAIIGALASDDFDAWKARPLRTDAEAQQANDDFDDLQARAIGADAAMIGGAILIGVGVTLLTIELASDDDRAALALEPQRTGAVLHWHGTFGEVW